MLRYLHFLEYITVCKYKSCSQLRRVLYPVEYTVADISGYLSGYQTYTPLKLIALQVSRLSFSFLFGKFVNYVSPVADTSSEKEFADNATRLSSA